MALVGGAAEQLENSKGPKIVPIKDTDKPLYDAVIPVESTKYLSYGQDLVGLSEVKAFPTRLESTS